MTAINLKDLLLKKQLEGVARKALSTAKRAGKSKKEAISLSKCIRYEELRKNILGLVLTWIDRNPLGDDGCTGYSSIESHNKNQLIRDGVVCSFKADAEYRDWIFSSEFEWEVDIEVVYSLPNNKTKSHRIEPICFVKRGIMKDLNVVTSPIDKIAIDLITHSKLVNEFRPDGDKNKGVFEFARYRVSCIGL